MKIVEIRQVTDQGWHTLQDYSRMDYCKKRIGDILDKVPAFTLITCDGSGHVEARGMSLKAHQGSEKLWFATHRSSRHAADLLANPQATLYFNDLENYEGLMLSVTAFEEESEEMKKACWRDFYESVFPGGISHPEFMAFRLETIRGNYGGKGVNLTFEP